MSRFFVPEDAVDMDTGTISLSGDEAYHAMNVMRLHIGDNVNVFDSAGNDYQGIVVATDKRKLCLQISFTSVTQKNTRQSVRFTLVQAIPKKSRMDHIIEKSTELGVNEIIPVVTDRTIVRPKGQDLDKIKKRWEKIAVAAAKQSGRVDVPVIYDIIKFHKIANILENYDLALMAALTDDAVPLKAEISRARSINPNNVLVMIGPEGDFTEREINSIKGRCRVVSLGDAVLKSDTAGIMLLAVLKYEFL